MQREMPAELLSPLDLLRVPGNALGFLVRRRLSWSRGPVELANEPKEALFEWLAPAARGEAEATARALDARYDLAALRARSSRLHYCENLALLAGLERLVGARELPASPDGVRRALDVGCGLFQYATALQRFLARGTRGPACALELRAIELDARGLHRDGHSRADHARAHAHLAGPGVSFEEADFLARTFPPQDVVTLFYPFLTRHALLAWGLPLACLRPRELFAHAVATLRPGGWLLVVNQTSTERELLTKRRAGLDVELVAEAPFASKLVPYGERTEERVGSLLRRT